MEYFNYAQLIIGPAGSGKSTYCKIIQDHAIVMKRNLKVINLDPAAENFFYKCDLDIRELINVTDVMQKLKYGPNGALIYCMEYLVKNITWLEDKLNEFGENVYYLIDCPGQLELYSHYNIMKYIVNKLKKLGLNICSIFCLDSTFLQEQSKFVSGCVLSLASMVQLELPHITVLTKSDLIEDKSLIELIGEGIDAKSLIEEVNPFVGKKMEKLNKTLIEFVENFSLVDLFPLDSNDEDSINALLYHADTILQYADAQDPREDDYDQAESGLQMTQEYNGDHSKGFDIDYNMI